MVLLEGMRRTMVHEEAGEAGRVLLGYVRESDPHPKGNRKPLEYVKQKGDMI